MLDICFSKNVSGSLKLEDLNNYNKIFVFSLGLSIGDIKEPLTYKRMDSLDLILEGDYELNYLKRDQDKAIANLESVIEGIKKDPCLRIWYSNEINEYLGMCWFIYELYKRVNDLPMILLMKCPDLVKVRDSVIKPRGWGELAHEEYKALLNLEEEANNGFITMAKMNWELQLMEDTNLRVMINGNIESVSEDFFDPFIIKEIKGMEQPFNETNLIVKIITKYNFGISDTYIAYRVNELVKQGIVEVVSEASKQDVSYNRILRKLI